MNPLIECVPNFSEGRRQDVIDAIVEEMVRNADVVRAMAKTDPLIERWQRRSFASMISSTLVVDRIALIGRQKGQTAIGLHPLEQIADLDIGVSVVAVLYLSPLSK